MLFEWDENKEKINISKHGLDFSTAALVFRDQNRLEWFDELHSDYRRPLYHDRRDQRHRRRPHGRVYRARRRH